MSGKDLYPINADFRNILRIFDMLDNENIAEEKKIGLIIKWFFEYFDFFEDENITHDKYDKAVEIFINFINTSSEKREHFVSDSDNDFESEENERQFCYNFDAEEIYAGFLSEYNIDLIDVGFLHWYKFKILLDNLSPESAFKKKIELRFMDLSGFHDNSRVFNKLIKAKEAVQLPMRFVEIDTGLDANLVEIKEFNEIWGKAGEKTR